MILSTKRKSKRITIGTVSIGAGRPIAIQSMAKTRTSDIPATIAQINRLDKAGCEIVRVAVKDHTDAHALRQIKRAIRIPLVADIHFDWTLGMEAIESGVDKIRLNPGNIFKKAQVREICAAAKLARIPIRVGLNSGSVGSRGDQVTAMVTKAKEYIRMLESFKFTDIAVSLKAQNAFDTIAAYRKMSKICDYPLHLGVTATGLPQEGLVKSYVAIGSLLLDGIGDTIRISLTDDPEEEVKAARRLLKSLGLRNFGPEIISCPTCGRCEVDLVSIVKQLEQKFSGLAFDPRLPSVKVAVMGCVVNGPGEARQADLGIAFGKKEGLLFRRGKPMRKVAADKSCAALVEEIRKINKG